MTFVSFFSSFRVARYFRAVRTSYAGIGLNWTLRRNEDRNVRGKYAPGHIFSGLLLPVPVAVAVAVALYHLSLRSCPPFANPMSKLGFTCTVQPSSSPVDWKNVIGQ
eukprot:scaffold25630_cov78-Cyclotella_meneghiniana.AAC.4